MLESNTPVLDVLRGKALPKREFHHIDIPLPDHPGASISALSTKRSPLLNSDFPDAFLSVQYTVFAC